MLFKENNYKKNLVKRLAISSIAGALVGYFIVHPFFIFVEHHLAHHYYSALKSILMSFGVEHLLTAITSVMIGFIIGFTVGLYVNKISYLNEKSLQLSITDDLTQIYNRRHLMNELNKEIERSKRFSLNLSIIMLDIDNLKNINDIHGHLIGDQAIQSIAKLLIINVRKIDFVARYGGDEFVIFMPETDTNTARILAVRLKDKISKDTINITGLSAKITISIGIANFPNNAKNMDDLICKADKALYGAKREGKDRIYNCVD